MMVETMCVFRSGQEVIYINDGYHWENSGVDFGYYVSANSLTGMAAVAVKDHDPNITYIVEGLLTPEGRFIPTRV